MQAGLTSQSAAGGSCFLVDQRLSSGGFSVFCGFPMQAVDRFWTATQRKQSHSNGLKRCRRRRKVDDRSPQVLLRNALSKEIPGASRTPKTRPQ